jgi:hypothetical protein
MQTFVPENNMRRSIEVLDPKRLGKQRVETLQIMKALAGLSKGWVNHPATKMWRGYEGALMEYQYYTCKHWTEHYGYRDTCFDKTFDVFDIHFNSADGVELPHWWGDNRVHDSHKKALAFKDPVWYNKIYPTITGEYNYYWPV